MFIHFGMTEVFVLLSAVDVVCRTLYSMSCLLLLGSMTLSCRVVRSRLISHTFASTWLLLDQNTLHMMALEEKSIVPEWNMNV